MELFDVHAHLDFPEFDRNRRSVLERMKRAKVSAVNSCLNENGLKAISQFLKEYPLYVSIGSTPYDLKEGYFEFQVELIKKNKDSIVAIGECGLDYYWVKDENGRARERENFLKLIELSKQLKKPMVIHSRNSEKPCLELLEAQGAKKVIMHCFSGTITEAERAVGLGYLISIPTNITRSKQKQELASRVPLENIVLETDAPYLAPEPETVNEPVNVLETAKKIAELKKLDVETVASQTTMNAKFFFGI